MKTAIVCLACASAATTAGAQCYDETRLFAPNPRNGHLVGMATAIDGVHAAFGTVKDSQAGAEAGCVFAFRRAGDAWTHRQSIWGSDTDNSDHFGYAIGLDGTTMIVGAYNAFGDGYYRGPGAAYVFQFDGQQWYQTQKLVPHDSATYDLFGVRIDLDGDRAIFGTPSRRDNGQNTGAAYIYRRVGGVWTEEAKLLPVEAEVDDGVGDGVAISGEWAFIGAVGDGDMAYNGGAVYVYRYNGTWQRVQKLYASTPNDWADFGCGIDADGDTLAVGCYYDENHGEYTGAVYIFRNQGGTWVQTQKILADDYDNQVEFGYWLDLKAGVLAVGATEDDTLGTSGGAAYVFHDDGTAFSQVAKLLPSDGDGWDSFGRDVSVSGTLVAVGAPESDVLDSNAGEGYIYDVTPCICPADLNNDGVLDSRDFTTFLNAFVAQDPLADFNGDGLINSNDFSAFLNAFQAGC
jgi:hypothetical protein